LENHFLHVSNRSVAGAREPWWPLNLQSKKSRVSLKKLSDGLIGA
jgi:hypothetical protein